ncbi:Crp/Fnr family transcriptional regulator [Lewinellaceae bacterium SD302]|nr:Crp/Fnr family transcriptional regulator [Lewinellaceae bacterium SD302]
MDNQGKIDLINEFAIFDHLNENEKVQLAEMMEEYRLSRYSAIYQPGDVSDTIYLLSKGTIKISTHNDEGKEVIKRLIHPEAIFGERSLVGEACRSESAQALKGEVVFYAVKVAAFQKIMIGNPALSQEVLRLFGSRLIAAEDRLENLIFKDARGRIIEFLHEVVSLRGQRVGFETLLKHSLTHQDIANITCTSRQTVTLVLNELRKDNLIYFNRGRILVRDMQQLRAIA